MLLRIIDSSSSTKNNVIRIILEDGASIADFYIEDYYSPMTKNFYDELRWFFKDYIESDNRTSVAAGLSGRLIRNGQLLGDALIGEDHQLTRCKDYIQTKGYHNLGVRFESGDANFFHEVWEALVLPDSKFILSGVANSYVRRWMSPEISAEYPELQFNLQHLPGEDQPALKSGKALKILHVTSRPDSSALDVHPGNSLDISIAALCTRAIGYEVIAPENAQQLNSILANNTTHIVHYDGPVVIADGIANIVLCGTNKESELLDVNEFARYLSENKIGVLCVDAGTYIDSGKIIPASQGLAQVAYSAHKQGVGNIIGLGQDTNAWISGECYKALYEQIVKGFNLDQAVVEARKTLQARTETDLTSVAPIPFMYWPLLVHYSLQPVEFFASPQSQVGFGDAQRLSLFKTKMFGFRSSLLPPLVNHIGDGAFPHIVNRLLLAQYSPEGVCVSISGEPGAGKTALAHAVALYLSEKECIDYAFYFSYADDYYTVPDIYQMIAPVMDLPADSLPDIKNKLFSSHCFFIFDDFSAASMRADDYLHLESFIQELAANGHHIFVVGNSSFIGGRLAFENFAVAPLTSIEQKILCGQQLRVAGSDCSIDQLAPVWEHLNGNPWLIKKVLPLLSKDNISRLTAELNEHINKRNSDESAINLFYEWRWGLLAPIWQRLLILFSDVRGLLLEMVMATADTAKDASPFKELFSYLGDGNINIGAGLSILEKAGFLIRLPHGRVVDHKCLAFVGQKRLESFHGLDIQFIDHQFSRLICEGIGMLSRHVIKQPNPAIYDNLLINRRHWVKHFENLWFNRDYKSFFSVKLSFDQLMHQSNLAGEIKPWIVDLLERSPVVNYESNAETKLAWLALAAEVISDGENSRKEIFLKSVLLWQNWFDNFGANNAQSELSLFHQVANFLDKFYKATNNFSACAGIQERAFPIYKEHLAWNKATQSLKSLAGYYSKLDKLESALIVECIIINDIPYSDFPPGYQLQQMIDILLLRIARKDVASAQELIDKTRAMDAGDHFAEILDGIQCDIDYLSGNYLAALRHYCRLWGRAISTEQVAHIDSLRQRLIELEQCVGTELFNAVFAREVPEGVVSPGEYLLS